jgi:regulator of RNase E activity RraA
MLSNTRTRFFLLALLLPLLGVNAAAVAQPREPESKQRSFIQFKKYSAEEDAKIRTLFEGLRVADVSDGLDIVGLQDVGLMDPAIHALWRDTEEFTHRFTGIAVTVRYVPTNRRASKMAPEEFKRWEGQWYRDLSPEPFVSLLRPGSVIVIDAGEDGDTGSIGSNNILKPAA